MTQGRCVVEHCDGDQIVAEAPIYADGTVAWDRAEAWVYEPASFRPLAKLQGEDLYYVVTDHIGTLRELISEDGTRTAWRARLGLWGETEALTRRAANDNTAPDCPIRFLGQWFDEESGLHYNRFRYYDPEAGQYLSPDPIGLAGGERPQGYVADPNGWVDPLGLAGCSDRLRANMMEDMGLPRATRAPGYQAQHLVPGALSNHPAVKLAGIDIDFAPNGIFLPDNRAPISPLSRHQGSHPGYNQAVEAALNRIDLSKGQQHAASQIAAMQDVLRVNQQNGVPIRSADWVGPYTPGGTATGTSRAFNRWDSILSGAGF